MNYMMYYPSFVFLHNDYPSVPEKRGISDDKLSDYCKKIADRFEIKIGSKFR